MTETKTKTTIDLPPASYVEKNAPFLPLIVNTKIIQSNDSLIPNQAKDSGDPISID